MRFTMNRLYNQIEDKKCIQKCVAEIAWILATEATAMEMGEIILVRTENRA
jgi:hypothetical protein